MVLDDLEDIGKRRQVEDQHHHALDAGRDAELVAAVAQVVEKVAVEDVLALLLQTERVVDLRARLSRHQRAQEGHVRARHFHIDHEVGAGEAEDQLQVVFAEQRRVDQQLLVGAVHDRQRERRLDEAVDDLADDVGALVAEEQRRQHLDLEVGAQPEVGQLRFEGGQHMADVARQVFELALQLEVADDALDRFAQRLARRVVGAVGRRRSGFVVFDVFGADGGAHEQEVVPEVAAVQAAA